MSDRDGDGRAVRRRPDTEVGRHMKTLHPVGRLGRVEEAAAAAVLYLTSNAAAFTTGISLLVDGGIMAR